MITCLFLFLAVSCANSKIKREYYASGKLKSEYEYIKRSDSICPHGFFRDYYENGKIWIQGEYSYGKLNGLLLRYRDNGILEDSAYWTNDTLNGPMFIYDAEGNLKVKRHYENGEKVGEQIIYNKGNVSIFAFYDHTGEQIYYREYDGNHFPVYTVSKDIITNIELATLEDNIAIGDTIEMSFQIVVPPYSEVSVLMGDSKETLKEHPLDNENRVKSRTVMNSKTKSFYLYVFVNNECLVTLAEQYKEECREVFIVDLDGVIKVSGWTP